MTEPVSVEVRAALLRFAASCHERAAAQLRLAASATLTAERMKALGCQMQAANDRELAEHPDLAELNVQMDGYYSAGSER